MEQRKKELKIKIEDTSDGNVIEYETNCVALVIADVVEGSTDQQVHTLLAGHCTKSETLSCAEGLGKAEKEMQARTLQSLGMSFEEFMKNFGKVAE